jgi:hypothetical protein
MAFWFWQRPCRARPVLWLWNECRKDHSSGNWQYTVIAGKAKWEFQANGEAITRWMPAACAQGALQRLGRQFLHAHPGKHGNDTGLLQSGLAADWCDVQANSLLSKEGLARLHASIYRDRADVGAVAISSPKGGPAGWNW